MRRQCLAVLVLSCVALIGLNASPRFAVAQPTAEYAAGSSDTNHDDVRTLSFRKVFVPQGQPEQWPTNGQPYFPVDRKRFEQLVRIVEQLGQGTAPLESARLVRTRYRARLDSPLHMVGQAEFEVQHRGQQPSLLWIAPWSLAIDHVAWHDSHRPVVCGTSPDGRLAVLVEQPGILRIDWSARGTQRADGAALFTWQVPPCALSTIELSTPVGVQLAAERTVVLPEPAREEDRLVWRVELGGRSKVALRIAQHPGSWPDDALPIVREQVAYDVSLRGLDVSANFEFDVHGRPLRRLLVEVASALSPVTAFYGDQRLPVSVVDTVNSSASVSQDKGTDTSQPSPPNEATLRANEHRLTKNASSLVAIDLPTPLLGNGQTVRLTASGQPVLDELQTLPTMRLRNVRWQQAETTVRVHDPLEVYELVPRRCVQSGAHVLPAPARGSAYVFQSFEPAASIALRIGRRVEPLQVARATSLVLKPEESTGHVIADLTLAAGQRFEVYANVAASWAIDSVASIPLGAVDDWTLEPAPRGTGQRRLHIRLSKPVRADQPTRLIISGRYVASARNQPLRGSALRLAEFEDAVRQTDLMSIQADSRYTLEIDGIERLDRVEWTSLDQPQRSLLVNEPGPLLFHWNHEAGMAAVSLAAGQPAFSASVTAHVLVTPSVVRQRLAITCLPDGDTLDQVVVRFSSADSSPVQWRMAGESKTLRSEKLSSETLETLGLLATGETWRVWLPRAMTTGFELIASRTSRRQDQHPLSLASLPLARTQRGRLIIEREGAARLAIRNHRLTPLPRDTTSQQASGPQKQAVVAGRFAYDPMTDTASATVPAIVVVRPPPSQLAPQAVVWHEAIDSYIEPAGKVQHVVRYWLENQGLSRLVLQWPPKATFVSLEVEPSEAEVIRPLRQHDTLIVPIPVDQRFVAVRLIYTTPARRGLGVRPQPLLQPTVTHDVAVLDRQWTVWLPPGYNAMARGSWQPLLDSEPGLWVRWFGPLGRPATRSPFDPMHLRDWRRGWRRLRDSGEMSASDLLTSLGVAAAALQRQPAFTVTWRRLLVHWAQHLAATGYTLRIDVAALRRAGIAAESPVGEAPPDSTSEQQGRELLSKNALAIVVRGHTVTLSTPAMVASWATPLENNTETPPSVFYVSLKQHGPFLPERDGTVVAEFTALDARSVAPYAWEFAVPRAWLLAEEGMPESRTAAGWISHRFIGGTKPLEIAIVRVGFLRWLGWCLMLATTWCVSRFLRHRILWAVATAAGVALVAIWLPVPFVPIASGILLGLLLGIAMSLVPHWLAIMWPTTPTSSPSTGRSTTTRALVSAGVLLLIAVAMGGRDAALADPMQSDVPTEIHRVLIPVDDQKQPAGDKCFVPQSFFDALQRLAAEARGEPQGWLIEQAHYRLTLPELKENPLGEAPQALETVELVAHYDIRLFSPAMPIRLALSNAPIVGMAATAPDLPVRVRVDGRPIDVVRQRNTGFLELWVAEAGLHEIEVRVPLKVRSRDDLRIVEASVPSVARSLLEVHVPHESFDVSVPSAVGPLSWFRKQQRCVASLGPTATLRVEWKPQSDAAVADRPIDVEHYYWWRIKPGAVVIDAEFRFTAPPEGLTQFEVVTHSQLRVLPAARDDSKQDSDGDRRVEIETVAGDPKRIRFRFQEPRRGETRLRVSMLLPEASGVAHLRLPRIETPDGRTTRRWLAISVDPALQYEWMSADRSAELDVEEFLRAWEQPGERPQMAFRLDGNGSGWEIATRPVPQRKVARQQVWVRCSRERTYLRFVARVEPLAGFIFQHRLRVPAGMTIENVSVVEEDVQNAARWHYDPQGRLTIFLSARAARAQRIEVHGFVPHEQKRRFELAGFAVLDADVQSTEVVLSRDPSVQVHVTDHAGLVAAESASGIAEGSTAFRTRSVAAYRAATTNYGLTLDVRPNTPKTRNATQTITLRQQDDAWQAELDLRLEIDGGQLDVLHIDVPANWTGPFAVSPEAEYRLVTLPGRASQRLVLWPRQSIDHTLHLTIRGPLIFEPGERVRLPQIDVRGIDGLQRFVVLPARRNGSEPTTWDTRGLRRVTELPPESVAAVGGAEIYQVIGEHGEATLRSSDGSVGHPQVWLADVRVAYSEQGRAHGVVTFDLEPSGMRRCVLRLPEGGRLAEVRVNGLPALVDRASKRTWYVPLDATELPQFIEVAFETVVEPSDHIRLSVPWLDRLPVERTIWTFAGPSRGGQPASTAEPIGPLALERLASNSIAELITHGVELSSQPSEELLRWYAAYSARLRAALARLNRWLPNGSIIERQNAMADLAAIEQERRRLAQQLHAISDRNVPATASMIDLWSSCTVLTEPATCWRFQGDQFELEIRFSNRTQPRGPALYAGSTAQKIWASLAVLAMGIGASMLGLRDICKRWPHFALAMAGFCWWLVLQPSGLGLMIMVAALLLSARIAWHAPFAGRWERGSTRSASRPMGTA